MKRRNIVATTVPAILIIFLQLSFAQGWELLGPDSVHWRAIYQMDGVFKKESSPKIVVATSKGIAINLDGQWKYPVRNFSFGSPPYFSSGDYLGSYFSFWNDSVAFVKVRGFSGEASYGCFRRVSNVFVDSTWRESSSTLCCQFCLPVSIAFSPHDIGKTYALSDYLYKSTNNGQTWSRQNVRFPSYLILFFLSNSLFDSTLYFGERSLTADSLTVVRSKNEGLTWNPILNLHSLFSKADMLAHGDTLILATSRSNVAGNDCGIYHSTDHGATWKQVLASVNVNALTQDESHPEIMYAATQNGIYRSLNAGMNWHLFNNTLPTNNLVDILQDSCSDIIYVASDLGVYKVLDSVVRVSENERLKTPAQFSLHQNYPNPFNTATLIEYKVTRPVEVSITIYDAMGKEVQQLVSSSHAPGFYRLRFESYHLASGIYYYTMRAGSFSETKQMTISK